MSDFGSDVGNSGLSLMGKIMEALLKLIGKIYESVEKRLSADYRLKKAELKDKQQKIKDRKFTEKIEGKAGFVNRKKLEKAGVPLTALGIKMSDEEFKTFAARCKREGIIVTGVEDLRERELNGRKFFAVECRQSDVSRINELIKLMNAEKLIENKRDKIRGLEARNEELRAEITSIKGKGEELSTEDLNKLVELEEEFDANVLAIKELEGDIDQIRYASSQELNQEQAQGVVEDVVYGDTEHGVTFEDAVNRYTSRELDRDTTTYVVDAKDPDRYIVCATKNDVFHDETYIKTTYEVYNADKKVYATHDGRFEGRPDNYWANERAAMKEKGGFSDLVFKFNSMEEVETYRANFKEQNRAELDKLEVGKDDRDFDKLIEELEEDLHERGGGYRNGVVVEAEDTTKPLSLTEGMDEVDRARIAEAIIIGRQIDIYKEMADINREFIVARADVYTTTEGTPERATAQSKLDAITGKYRAALEREENLVSERMEINAVQAEHDTRTSKARDMERSDGKLDAPTFEDEGKRRTKEEYRKEINDRKTVDDGKNHGKEHQREAKKHKSASKDIGD